MRILKITFCNMVRLSALFLLSCLLVLNVMPVKAIAGDLELDDAQNAKLSRYKVKERVMKNEKQEDYVKDEEDSDDVTLNDLQCGSVNIGNVVNPKGFGGPKEIDVIITGDVINANNKCK